MTANPPLGALLNGLCYYADCWGFSARVERDSDAVFRDLQGLHEYLATSISIRASEPDCPRPFLHSDSLFLVAHLTPDLGRNEAIVDATLQLVEKVTAEAYRRDLPLRGSFGFGSLAARDSCLVGTAVVNAVRLADTFRAPLSILARHTLQCGVSLGVLSDRMVGIGHAGGVEPRMRLTINCGTKDGGFVLGQPVLYGERSIQVAEEWLQRTRDANLQSAAPVSAVAGVLAEMASMLANWKSLQ